MNKGALFCVILLGLGIFLWLQRDHVVVSEGGRISAAGSAGHSIQQDARFIIREKVKPGGYIGWHTSELDAMTSSPKQTRQASNYYLVCTEMNSGTQRVFQVPASTFNMERLGNVLTAQQVSGFREVTNLEEPPLPPSFQFRRREP